MFKVILADGSTVWVEGTYLQELMEVLSECGDLHVEEQDPNVHAPGGADVFDLSGTQNDFKGKAALAPPRPGAVHSCAAQEVGRNIQRGGNLCTLTLPLCASRPWTALERITPS